VGFNTKYQKYSEMVRVDSVEEAKISIDRLIEEFKNSKQMVKKDRILNITEKAGMKALRLSEDVSRSVKDRQISRKIAQLYNYAWMDMFRLK